MNAWETAVLIVRLRWLFPPSFPSNMKVDTEIIVRLCSSPLADGPGSPSHAGHWQRPIF